MLDREQERRRKKYKYALVRWEHMDGWEDTARIAVEHKEVLEQWWIGSHTVLCDDQPYTVLEGMRKLLITKEN